MIASEVAVGENTYYGSIRPIGDDCDKTKAQGDSVVGNAEEAAGIAATAFNDWTSTGVRCDDDRLEYTKSPLPLQLFISSLSDALSYTSADTTGTEFRYSGPHGSSVLNVTPMGSTTKLIASETSSNFKVSSFWIFFFFFATAAR